MGVGVEEGGQDGRPGGLYDAVGRRVRRGVQAGETILLDQDVAPLTGVQHVPEQDGVRHAESAVQALVFREDPLRVLQQEASPGREGDAAALPFEKFAAGGFLQLGNVLADSRLRNTQGLCRGSETAQRSDLGENA